MTAAVDATMPGSTVPVLTLTGFTTHLPVRRPMSLVPEVTYTKPILSGREIEVLLSWFRCDSKSEVAKSLFLSLGTVNTHLTRIRAKYAAIGRPAPTKAALVARALQDRLIDITDL